MFTQGFLPCNPLCNTSQQHRLTEHWGSVQADMPEDWEPPPAVQSAWTLRGQYYRMAKAAWHCGMTPGTVVRTLGPWGRSLTRSYTTTHRSMFDSDEQAAIFEPYLHQCLSSPGSGEVRPLTSAPCKLNELLSSAPYKSTELFGNHRTMFEPLYV